LLGWSKPFRPLNLTVKIISCPEKHRKLSYERLCSSHKNHDVNSGIRQHASHICINTFRINEVSHTPYCIFFSKIIILFLMCLSSHVFRQRKRYAWLWPVLLTAYFSKSELARVFLRSFNHVKQSANKVYDNLDTTFFCVTLLSD
jgi:hypothetical protein